MCVYVCAMTRMCACTNIWLLVPVYVHHTFVSPCSSAPPPPQDVPSTETIDEYRPGVLEVLGITEMATSA